MKTSLEKNYKKLFTLLFTLSGIVLSFIVTFLVYIESNDAKSKLERKEVNYLLDNRKNILNDFLKDNFNIITSFSNNDFFYNYIENQKYTSFQMFLRSIQSYDKNIENIRYIDAKGNELIKLKRIEYGSNYILNHSQNLINIKNEDIFKKVMTVENGDIYFTELQKLNLNNEIKYKLSIAYKVYDDYDVLGIFILDFYLDDLIINLTSSNSFYTYILDKNNCIIATNRDDINVNNNDCISKKENDLINKIQIFSSKNQKLFLAFEGKEKLQDFFSELNNTFILVLIIIIIISLYLSSFLANIPNKLNEKILEQKKMFMQQSKFAAMGEMIAVISHQWRQPLNEISLLIDEIKLKFKYKMLTEDEINFLSKEIDDSLNYMSNTIEDFNNFFKPNKEKELFYIKDLFEESLNLLRSKITSKNISITIEQSNDSIEYFGYKNELKQVLINILHNAVDALIAREIENKNISLTYEIKDKNLILAVQDNAAGIDVNIIDDIFNPYFSTKLEKNGTGLGLYISKVIIQNNMHGKIDVENINKGARFTITLPINDIQS